MSNLLASRGPLGFAAAALAGGLSAMFFVVALMHAETVLIFLAYLAATPLFIAGLGAGHVAGVTASLAALVSLYFANPETTYAVTYAFINAVPAVALIGLALRYRVGEDKKVYWYPEGYLLTAITLYSCLVFLAILGLTASEEGGLLGMTARFIAEGTAAMKVNMTAEAAIQFTGMMDRLTMFLPALAGCSWILIIIISMGAAQMILQQQKWNLREAFVLSTLDMPNWLIYATAATGLIGAFAPAPYDYIGTNLSIILCVPFFFVGLAITHAYADSTKYRLPILIGFYLTLSIFPGFVLLAALLGAIDQWVHFRQRLAAGPKQV